MSTLIEFIKSLSPRTNKSTVEKDLDSTLKELSTIAMPMVKSMADTTIASPLKSEWVGVFESHIRAQLKFSKKSSNIWLDLYAALVNVQSNAEYLRKAVDDYLQEDTLRDGITGRAAHIIRLAGAVSFITTYTAEVCDYSLAQEAVTLGDAESTPPAQAKYIRGSLEKYVRLLMDMSLPPKEFEKLFTSVPDMFLSEGNMATVAAMFTPKEIDPFRNLQTATNFTGSPIYMARLMWETWQADRFHAMKERKAMMELRLIHLQNKQAGSDNPRLQAEIEGLQARINKYDRRIREVEASL